MCEFPSTEKDGKFLNGYLLVILTLLLSSVSHMHKSLGFCISFGFDNNSYLKALNRHHAVVRGINSKVQVCCPFFQVGSLSGLVLCCTEAFRI